MYLVGASRSGGIAGGHYATLGLKSCATPTEVRIVAVYVLINPVQINVAAARLFGKRSFLDIQTGSMRLNSNVGFSRGISYFTCSRKTLNLCIVETYSHIFHSLPVALQVEKAYKQLALQFHPDKTGGDAALAEHFKEVKSAYEVSLTNSINSKAHLVGRVPLLSIARREQRPPRSCRGGAASPAPGRLA